jgi:hypothetical protein
MSSLVLTIRLVLLQDIPSSDPADQSDEDVWETVGVTVERNTSSPPASEEVVPEGAQQQTSIIEAQTSVEKGQSLPPAAGVAMEQPEETPVEAGAASEAAIVDIASILGAPTVTIVRSTL